MNPEILKIVQNVWQNLIATEDIVSSEKRIRLSNHFFNKFDIVQAPVSSLLLGVVDRAIVESLREESSDLLSSGEVNFSNFNEESKLLSDSFKDLSYILVEINSETKKSLVDISNVNEKIDSFSLKIKEMVESDFKVIDLSRYDFESLQKRANYLKNEIGTSNFKPMFFEVIDNLSEVVNLAQSDKKEVDLFFESLNGKLLRISKDCEEISQNVQF